jgi:cellulose synthase/poly-beta-1,6-N-acetylglucosamine synthase-like glycosyltransferase
MYWLPAILILPYVLLLLKIYGNLRRLKTFYVSHDPQTFVSVVVACRNEEKNLYDLLNHISAQSFPRELFEVIIVDDNSTDTTFETASEFTGNINIQTVKNRATGKKEAIRTGVSLAKGKLIITTDADCRMGNNWIKTIAAFFEKTGADLIICPVRIEPSAGFFGKFQELEFLSLQGITAGTAGDGNGTMCNGANLGFKREVYYKNVKNLRFDVPTGDDIFFLHSLKKKADSKVLWLESDDALVTSRAVRSLRAYLNQRKRWISKAGKYSDGTTILLGILTFAAVVLQISYFFASFLCIPLMRVFLSVLILKSVPDFLILFNTSNRYGKRNLMKWFLPAQLLYPFYVLSVLTSGICNPESAIRNAE